MTLALILFAFTYCLMLALPRFRPFAALGGAGAFFASGAAERRFPVCFRLQTVVRLKIHLGIGISNYGT